MSVIAQALTSFVNSLFGNNHNGLVEDEDQVPAKINQFAQRFDLWEKLIKVENDNIASSSSFPFTSLDCVQRGILVLLSYKKMELDENDAIARKWTQYAVDSEWLSGNVGISEPVDFLVRDVVVDIMIIHCIMNRPRRNQHGGEVYLKLVFARCCKHMAMCIEMYLRGEELEWSLVSPEDLAYFFHSSYFWDQHQECFTFHLGVNSCSEMQRMIANGFGSFITPNCPFAHFPRSLVDIFASLELRFNKWKEAKVPSVPDTDPIGEVSKPGKADSNEEDGTNRNEEDTEQAENESDTENPAEVIMAKVEVLILALQQFCEQVSLDSIPTETWDAMSSCLKLIVKLLMSVYHEDEEVRHADALMVACPDLLNCRIGPVL